MEGAGAVVAHHLMRTSASCAVRGGPGSTLSIPSWHWSHGAALDPGLREALMGPVTELTAPTDQGTNRRFCRFCQFCRVGRAATRDPRQESRDSVRMARFVAVRGRNHMSDQVAGIRRPRRLGRAAAAVATDAVDGAPGGGSARDRMRSSGGEGPLRGPPQQRAMQRAGDYSGAALRRACRDRRALGDLDHAG